MSMDNGAMAVSDAQINSQSGKRADEGALVVDVMRGFRKRKAQLLHSRQVRNTSYLKGERGPREICPKPPAGAEQMRGTKVAPLSRAPG